MTDCGHCGFGGELEKIEFITVESQTQDVPNWGEATWTKYWMLYRCPECREPTLISDWWSDEFGDPEAETWKPIFPTPRDNAAVPGAVLSRYQQANLVKGRAPGLYAVGVRTTLEAMCQEEGAEGDDLFHQLDDLAAKGRLPDQLAEMGHQLRKLSRFGAHAKEFEVTTDDVPLIEDFAEAIIEYMYRAPAKLRAAKASLDERQGRI